MAKIVFVIEDTEQGTRVTAQADPPFAIDPATMTAAQVLAVRIWEAKAALAKGLLVIAAGPAMEAVQGDKARTINPSTN